MMPDARRERDASPIRIFASQPDSGGLRHPLVVSMSPGPAPPSDPDLLIVDQDPLKYSHLVREARSDYLDEYPTVDGVIQRPALHRFCLLYTSPSPRDKRQSRMPSSA